MTEENKTKLVNDDGMMRVWMWRNEVERDGSISNLVPNLPRLCLIHSPTVAQYSNKQAMDLHTHPLGKEIEALANLAGVDQQSTEPCSEDFTIPAEWWDETEAISVNEALGYRP